MNYPVLCRCGAPAAFKIASEWSDGITAELKTYALSCTQCVAPDFAEAKRRQQACPLALDESLGEPHVYERGSELKQRPELESC
jgi:hypothetical protein